VTSSSGGPDPLPPGAVHTLLEETRVLLYLRVAQDGSIRAANRMLVRWSGIPESDLVGTPVLRLLVEDDKPRMKRWLEGGSTLPSEPTLLNFVSVRHEVHTLRCRLFGHGDDVAVVGEPDVEEDRTVTEELLLLNNELSVLSRESARRNRELEVARRELAETLAELENSYWHMQKIQEYMPVCMRCGKMKTGDSEWESLLEYLRSNEILVSHGYCPACADEVMDEESIP